MVARLVALQTAGGSHTQCGTDRCRAVAGAKCVIGAFAPFWETAQSAICAERIKAVSPSGKYLVGIGLVAHIPHQTVVGRIEYIVQSHSQFDSPQTRGQMSRMGGEGVDDIGPQLVGYSLQVAHCQSAQVFRGIYFFQLQVSCFWCQ